MRPPAPDSGLRALVAEVVRTAVLDVDHAKGNALAAAVAYFAEPASAFVWHAEGLGLDREAVRERLRARLVQRLGAERAAALWKAASGAGPPQDERSKVTPTEPAQGARIAAGAGE